MDSGYVLGLARRAVSRAAMEELKSCLITPELGVLGDCKGQKFPLRQVTILAREDWDAALAELDQGMGPIDLPWTVRRANVFVEHLDLPQGAGSIVAVGSCMLQVTEETTPCAQMEQAWRGLRRALAPDWRGGITCKVLTGGTVAIGDKVKILKQVAKRKVHLPG